MYIPEQFPSFKKKKDAKQKKRQVNFTKYNKWKNHILKRDHNCCQFNTCMQTKGLEVHHIKRWVDAPHLRYSHYNGISLCVTHHQLVTNNEARFELQFLQRVMLNEARIGNGFANIYTSGHAGAEASGVSGS